jgi:predicted amidophosphoribosyltransferase
MLVPPLCWGCGGVARRREPLCGGCRRILRRLAPEPVLLCGVRVWAPVAYSGPARDLVRALKFRGATAAADAMAAQIAANAPAELLGAAGAPAELLGAAGAPAELLGAAGAPAPRPVLVPVPLHPHRLRRRGYNQAALIADALASRAGLEVAHCLARGGSAATQVGRDRSERRAGPAGSVQPRERVPERVLLVDDVATTGATLAACAAAARAAGAAEVAALVFARTIGR